MWAVNGSLTLDCARPHSLLLLAHTSLMGKSDSIARDVKGHIISHLLIPSLLHSFRKQAMNILF